MDFSGWDWIGNYTEERAKLTPAREAIYDLDNKTGYTYKQLDERANKLANFLVDEIDIDKGDRIAFLSRNRMEMFDAFFATGKIGAIFVPYNLRLTVNELEKLIEKEKPSVLFYEKCFQEKVEELKKRVNIEHYIILSDTDQNYDCKDKTYKTVNNYNNKTPRKYKDLNLEEIHLIVHTGGTTGLPKGAMLSHRGVLFNCLNEVITWNINHKDSTHLLLPLFHTGGWHLLTLPLLMVGGKVIINKQFEPGLALDVIDNMNPTFVFGAATIFRMMYDHDDFADTDFSSVRWVMSGAAPTPIQVMEEFWKKGVRFCAGYGLTEGGPNNLAVPAEFMNMEQLKEKHASVGKPFYFTETKIVDEDGQEVEVGEEGELIFSGPQIFSGYWDNEEETKNTLRNGWVYTGDMAKKDEDGFYYIVGRKKNMYISGGENVFPPEIENCLYKIPEVHEVCVIGVPDDKWGEVGKAVISVKPDRELTKEQVMDHLHDKLAKYKIPKYIKFVKEVPKNSVGKIVASEVEKVYGDPED